MGDIIKHNKQNARLVEIDVFQFFSRVHASVVFCQKRYISIYEEVKKKNISHFEIFENPNIAHRAWTPPTPKIFLML